MTELLAPAGTLEKMLVAFHYGADAIYFAGPRLGLRYAADNFSQSDMLFASKFARDHNKKIYCVVNALPQQAELDGMREYLEQLKNAGISTVIMSDPFLVKLAIELGLVVHVSTQTSVLNRDALNFWADLGASRIVLARELSIDELATIRNATKLELEVFIHGAMCISLSGHCYLSNISRNRDANRGGCAQNCRVKYQVRMTDQSDYFISSPDLCSVSVIERLLSLGIDSFKIEGRMKGVMYLGPSVRVYTKLLKQWRQEKFIPQELLTWADNELQSTMQRPYFSGALDQSFAEPARISGHKSPAMNSTIAGIVREKLMDGRYLVEAKNAISQADVLEFLMPDGENRKSSVHQLLGLKGEAKSEIRPGEYFFITNQRALAPHTLIRRPVRR